LGQPISQSVALEQQQILISKSRGSTPERWLAIGPLAQVAVASSGRPQLDIAPASGTAPNILSTPRPYCFKTVGQPDCELKSGPKEQKNGDALSYWHAIPTAALRTSQPVAGSQRRNHSGKRFRSRFWPASRSREITVAATSCGGNVQMQPIPSVDPAHHQEVAIRTIAHRLGRWLR
jgi:hypothetical protein